MRPTAAILSIISTKKKKAKTTSMFSRAALNWMCASLGAWPERSAAVYVMSLFEIDSVITWLGRGLGLGVEVGLGLGLGPG